MKKILTHLTGIVFLITILAAGACSQTGSNGIQPLGNDGKPPITWEELDTVIIYLKAVEIEEKMHLEMYDSNKPDSIVIDNLYTDVRDLTVVIWKLANDSGIRKIIKIKPKKPDGEIMPRSAKGLFTPKKKKHKVPDNQTPLNQEEYLIKFKDTNGNTHTIDPYLKIPKRK